MGEENKLMPEKVEVVNFDMVTDSLSAFVEKGTEGDLVIFGFDELGHVWDALTGVSSELVGASKVFTILKVAASIPDKVFMNKLERYCQGLVKIPVEKRESYIKKVGKKGLNKDSVLILGLLNKIEELEKIELFLALFEAMIDEMISNETYRRLMLLVDRTMYADIEYLQKNISDDLITIETEEQEGLLANGWLTYCGQMWGSATEESRFVYQYTNTAKLFCTLVQK